MNKFSLIVGNEGSGSHTHLIPHPKLKTLARLDDEAKALLDETHVTVTVGPSFGSGACWIITSDDRPSATEQDAALRWAAAITEETNQSAVIIDFAQRGFGLTRRLKADHLVGLRDILNDETLIDEHLLQGFVLTGRYCDFLPLGQANEELGMEDKLRGLEKVLECCSRIYDCVIVLSDPIPGDQEQFLSLAQCCDNILVAARIGSSPLEELKDLRTFARGYKVPLAGTLALREKQSLHKTAMKVWRSNEVAEIRLFLNGTTTSQRLRTASATAQKLGRDGIRVSRQFIADTAERSWKTSKPYLDAAKVQARAALSWMVSTSKRLYEESKREHQWLAVVEKTTSMNALTKSGTPK